MHFTVAVAVFDLQGFVQGCGNGGAVGVPADDVRGPAVVVAFEDELFREGVPGNVPGALPGAENRDQKVPQALSGDIVPHGDLVGEGCPGRGVGTAHQPLDLLVEVMGVIQVQLRAETFLPFASSHPFVAVVQFPFMPFAAQEPADFGALGWLEPHEPQHKDRRAGGQDKSQELRPAGFQRQQLVKEQVSRQDERSDDRPQIRFLQELPDVEAELYAEEDQLDHPAQQVRDHEADDDAVGRIAASEEQPARQETAQVQDAELDLVPLDAAEGVDELREAGGRGRGGGNQEGPSAHQDRPFRDLRAQPQVQDEIQFAPKREEQQQEKQDADPAHPFREGDGALRVAGADILGDLRRRGGVKVRNELIDIVLHRGGIVVGSIDRRAEEGVDEHVGPLGTGDHGRGGKEVVVVEHKDLLVGLPFPDGIPADEGGPPPMAEPVIYDEGNPRGYAHEDCIHPESVALPIQQADDESELHERIDNVHDGNGREPFMDGEQALERDVGDAQAGDESGDLEDEHRIGFLPGRYVQVMVDVPDSYGLQDQQQHERSADVDHVADVEHPVRVSAGLAHLDVHETDRRGRQGTRDERNQRDGAAHGRVDAHIRGSQRLQHQAAGDESHNDGNRHPYIHDGGVAGDPYVRVRRHRLQI